ALGYRGVADVALVSGRLDDAAKAYEHNLQLTPNAPIPQIGLHDIELLRERWPEANARAQKLAGTNDSFSRALGGTGLALNVEARWLLATSQHAPALATAERALKDSASRSAEWDSLA